MAAYVVNAQVAGVRPRRAERAPAVVARPVAPSRPAATPPTPARAATDHGDVMIDLVGRPLEAVLRDRWARIGEIWAQTTFYLFDPDSWR